MNHFKHAIVIGASSGIGAELVRQLGRSGVRVAAVARRSERLEQLAAEVGDQVLWFRHDVTNYDEAPVLFQEICHQLGGLDLIVYCAGVMPPVGPNEFDFAKDQKMVEVNVMGAMSWLNLAAERFQNTGHGSIVGMGSVAGDRGRAAQPAYNSSKAALATYLEALRNRLTKHGIKVVTIKPGPTDTEMASHMRTRKTSAAAVAEFTISRAHRNGEHYVKLVHRMAFAVIRVIPGPIFRRLPL